MPNQDMANLRGIFEDNRGDGRVLLLSRTLRHYGGNIFHESDQSIQVDLEFLQEVFECVQVIRSHPRLEERIGTFYILVSPKTRGLYGEGSIGRP